MDKYYLKDIALHISDGEHGTVHDSPSSFLLLSNKNIVDGRIMISSQERTISEEDFKRINKRAKVQKNSILLSTVGEIGKTAFVYDDNVNYTFQRSVGIINANESRADPYFIYLYLQLPYVQKYMDVKSKGSVQKCLFINDMCNLEIYLPDLSTQGKISSVIGNIDKKIYLNTQINAELESLAKTIYEYWFLQFDFPNKDGKPYKSSGGAMIWNEDLKMEIPEGWEVTTLGKIIVEQPKSTIPVEDAKTAQGNIPFFTSGDAILKWNKPLVSGRNCYLNDGGNADVRYYIGETAYSTHTWCITGKNGTSDFLYLTLVTLKPELDIKYFQGSTLKNLNKSALKKRPFFVPPVDVMASFNKIIQPIFDMISENVRQNQELTNLRDFLLPLLMNGQVGFKDA